MKNNNFIPSYETRFESISDFKWSLECGAEINLIWRNKMYVIIGCVEEGIAFSEGCYEKDGKYYNVISHTEYNPKEEIVFQTADEVLDITINGERLRDVITQVRVTDRTI